MKAVWIYGHNPVARWRYRHIPGPKPRWMLGNALELKAKMAHVAYTEWAEQYGPIFRIFICLKPYVVITGKPQPCTLHQQPYALAKCHPYYQ